MRPPDDPIFGRKQGFVFCRRKAATSSRDDREPQAICTHLISATKTKTGLTVKSRIDDRLYPKGRRIGSR